MENNEQNVNNVANKGAGFLIIIVALLVVILGLGGYVLYDKFTTDDAKDNTEEKVKEKTEKVENLEVTSKEVTDLFTSITKGLYDKDCGLIFDYFKDKKVTVNDIDNDTVTSITLYHLYNSGIKFVEGSTFTKKQAEDTINKLFGNNYKYTHKNITASCPNFAYDEAKELYTAGPSGCGGECGPFHNMMKVVKATKSDSNIELYVRVLFYSFSKYNYYSDYNASKEVVLEKDNDGVAYETDANYSKGSLYKMTFTKEDNNYVFTSSEPVNE